MREVILVCGVPGSGKTWVCRQLPPDKFQYIPHDEHLKDIVRALAVAARTSSLPIVTECPFGERGMREQLETLGCVVKPVFVVESPDVIWRRYADREGKSPSKSTMTRASSIINRAEEWGAPHGTSSHILNYLLKEKA